MIKSLKNTPASEAFVYREVSDSEKKLEEKIDEIDKKAEKRHDKIMTQLVDIAGQFKKFGEEQVILSARSKDHTDRIEKLENAIYATS